MRVLIITHNYSIYGASRSLRTMLKPIYEHWDIDIVVPKRIINKVDINKIGIWFNIPTSKIYPFALPFSNIYKGKAKTGFFFSCLNNTKWFFAKRKLYKHIENNNYDLIYLNSLTLCEIIKDRYPFLIHVREIFDNSKKNVPQLLNKAKGIIFIDESTAHPFKRKIQNQYWILNNPFDMTGINKLEEPRLKINITNKNKVIFAMIGAITEDKGIAFVISSFIKSKIDATLLIVGNGEAHYLSDCKKLANNNANIIFYGEEENIDKIYAAIDYVVRGEPYQCIGRTVYEALFAGCNTIVPNETLSYNNFFENDKFKNQIHLYQPRNQDQFIDLLKELSNIKLINKIGQSNVMQYFHDFNQIVQIIIKENV